MQFLLKIRIIIHFGWSSTQVLAGNHCGIYFYSFSCMSLQNGFLHFVLVPLLLIKYNVFGLSQFPVGKTFQYFIDYYQCFNFKFLVLGNGSSQLRSDAHPSLLGVKRGPAARYKYSYPGLPLEQEPGWEAGSRRRVGDAKHRLASPAQVCSLYASQKVKIFIKNKIYLCSHSSTMIL